MASFSIAPSPFTSVLCSYGGPCSSAKGSITKPRLSISFRLPSPPNPQSPRIAPLSFPRGPVSCSLSEGTNANDRVYNVDPSLLKRLTEVKVLSVDEKPVKVVDLWNGKRALIAWARHFGCVLCRKRAALLASMKGDLDALGVTLVIIGPGSSSQANAFAEQTSFPGEVYADPNYSSFRAMNFIFGAQTIFTPNAGLNVINAFREGYRQDWNLSFQQATVMEGAWYQGGIMVAGPSEDELLFLHTDKEAGDEPDMKALLDACKS